MSEAVQETTTDAAGQEPQSTDAGSVEATETQQASGVESLPEWAQTEIKNLRQESAKRRKATRDAEKLAQAAEESALAEQKKYQELAEVRQARISELEPMEAAVTEYRETVTEILNTRTAELGEKAQTAIDSLEGMDELVKLKWLNANAALFARQTPPQIDATTTGETEEVVATEEQVKAFASKMHLDWRTVDPKTVPI